MHDISWIAIDFDARDYGIYCNANRNIGIVDNWNDMVSLKNPNYFLRCKYEI